MYIKASEEGSALKNITYYLYAGITALSGPNHQHDGLTQTEILVANTENIKTMNKQVQHTGTILTNNIDYLTLANKQANSSE